MDCTVETDKCCVDRWGSTSLNIALSFSPGHIISFSMLIETSYVESINNKLVNIMYYTELLIKVYSSVMSFP